MVSALQQVASAAIFTTKGTKDTKEERSIVGQAAACFSAWAIQIYLPLRCLRELRVLRGKLLLLRPRQIFYHEGHEGHEARKEHGGPGRSVLQRLGNLNVFAAALPS